MSEETAPQFTKQMVIQHSLTPRSATVSLLPILILGQFFPHTFEQPADLFHTLYTQHMPFATLYTHLSGTLQRDLTLQRVESMP